MEEAWPLLWSVSKRVPTSDDNGSVRVEQGLMPLVYAGPPGNQTRTRWYCRYEAVRGGVFSAERSVQLENSLRQWVPLKANSARQAKDVIAGQA